MFLIIYGYGNFIHYVVIFVDSITKLFYIFKMVLLSWNDKIIAFSDYYHFDSICKFLFILCIFLNFIFLVSTNVFSSLCETKIGYC